MKDYYKILGIDKNASQEEIKRAYRKLAMKHHPDRNGGDDKQFKEIQEAYDILSNEQSKQQYDHRPSNEFHQFGGMPHGFDDIFEQMFGRSGFQDLFNRNRPSTQKNKTLNLKVSIRLEDVFFGKNFVISVKLPSGKDQLIEINVPPGIENNSNIRYTGIGDDSISSAPRGDIIVNIVIEKDAQFERNGVDLIKTIELTMWDAALGTNLIVDTIDKKQLEVKINPGIQPGQIISLTGQGLPYYNSTERGRLLLICNVKIPVLLTDEQKSLLEQSRN